MSEEATTQEIAEIVKTLTDMAAVLQRLQQAQQPAEQARKDFDPEHPVGPKPPEAPVVPTEAVSKTPVAQTARPAGQLIVDLAFECGYQATFVKEAIKRWPGYTRSEAEHDYINARRVMIESGKWKTRATNARRIKAAAKVAQTGPAQPIVTPAAPVSPTPAAPVNPAPASPEALLWTIEQQARIICTNGNGDAIGAIKYIREKTGFGLLEAKLWTDVMRGYSKEEPIMVTNAKQEYLRRMMTANRTTLDQQVQDLRQAVIKKEMDPVAGKVEAQKKIDIAGDNKSMLVQAARRIARDLAVNGPITVDDVTRAMSERYNVLPTTGTAKRHSWKGSIFTKTEWVYIGTMASQQKSAHARPVGMWALKSWLATNTMNGCDSLVSSFTLSRLYGDFKRQYPTADLSKCNCYIGEERLSTERKDTIVRGGNKLYEIPVTFIPSAIGAIITLSTAAFRD